MGSQDLLASKVVFLDEDAGTPELILTSKNIAGIVGLFPRGPIGVPTLVTSEKDAFGIFGAFDAVHKGAESVRSYFGEGGKQLYIVRTCHYTDPTNASTLTAVKASGGIEAVTAVAQPAKVIATLAAPYNLVHTDQLDIAVDGGAAVAAVFTGFAGFLNSAGAEPFNLSGGESLTVRINGGALQTLLVTAGDIAIATQATALEVANTLNRMVVGGKFIATAGLNVIFESDVKGTSAAAEVTGGTANAGILDFPVASMPGGGNVADLSGVTVAEIKAIVEAAVAGTLVTALAGNLFDIATVTTGVLASIEVVAGTSPAAPKLGLDTLVHNGTAAGSAPVISVSAKDEGAYGNAVQFRIQDATSGIVSEFNLYVLYNGNIVERYPNVTMTSTAVNYVITKVNTDSGYVVLTDLGIGTRPTNSNATTLLLGGDNGLVGLNDNDYIGTSTAENGLYAFEKIGTVNLLAIPGITSPTVLQALLNYCEITKGGIPYAIIEGPQGSNYRAITTFQTVNNLKESTDCGGLYWPWAKIANPDVTIYGDEATITVPPSALVMGRIARTDTQIPGGIYQAPAGPVYGTLDTVFGVDSADAADVNKRDVVYPLRINPIWGGNGVPYYIDGSRTLKESSQYPGIGQRRGRSGIQLDLGVLVDNFRHLRGRNATREELGRVCTRYLTDQTGLGAFESDNPATAFTVDVGKGLNPDRDMRRGILRVACRFRLVGAIEWVIVLIGPTPEEE